MLCIVCTITSAYILFWFLFIIYYLSNYLFTCISYIYCFNYLFYSSSLRSLCIHFDLTFIVGYFRSVGTHTPFSACLKFSKASFFSFPKKLWQESFLYILYDNKNITPNSGVSPTKSHATELNNTFWFFAYTYVSSLLKCYCWEHAPPVSYFSIVPWW